MGFAIRLRETGIDRLPPKVLKRSRRVQVLLLGILILSLADLAVTMTHLKTTGMMEANPIAEYLIKYTQSPGALIAFKLSTVGVCMLLLHRLRFHWEGEAAAWVAVIILAGMSIMWHTYSQEYDDPATVTVAQYDHSGNWLRFD
ncbi:MAG TPA: DUF5658 family protein [Phycisphaerales bacterium]|nr:DUF5658 family protein [Phycisphaerales bacterium]